MRDAYIGVRVPAPLLERMDAIAPPEYLARSRFVREAIERRLAEIEAKAADPSLSRESGR